MPAERPAIGSLRFFTDRNLGSRTVPNLLRAAGWNVVTMNEFYGPQSGESVDDVVWVREATERGFILLCADAAMAAVPLEARTIKMCSARVFAISRKNAQLRGTEQGVLFLRHQSQITQLALREGPYSFAVTRSGLREQKLLG